MSRKIRRGVSGLWLLLVVLLCVVGGDLFANPPRTARDDARHKGAAQKPAGAPFRQASKVDRPNRLGLRLMQRHEAAIEAQRLDRSLSGRLRKAADAEVVTDRVLVVLVEFAGEDTFAFTPGVSIWDPYGRLDTTDDSGTDQDCSAIVSKNGLTEKTDFTYSGPLHNEIPRPPSADSSMANTIWTEDFSADWYKEMLFGDGVQMVYKRGDGSEVNLDFRGESLRHYYADMSGGKYDVEGDVVGWLKVPHSIWYYGADSCPGARSGGMYSDNYAIPEAGDPVSLVKDVVDLINQQYPGFDWTQYDRDGDGLVDRLWIIHAGVGEEDDPDLLNLTTYGEGSIWSHSSEVYPAYQADPTNDVSIGPYIMMPENGGISVFAHESGHNLGAIDLYDTDGLAETSAGFWSLMADDWVGYPIGFLPPPMDPLHMDELGWLDPKVSLSDPSQTYTVLIGQTSSYPNEKDMARGVQIWLPDGVAQRPVQPHGHYEWWGGRQNDSQASMTLAAPVTLPQQWPTALYVDLAYDIEQDYDYLHVQISTDDGQTFSDLTNDSTDPNAMAFTGTGSSWPDFKREKFDLSAYAGKSVRLRFLYATDAGTVNQGPYIDDIDIEEDGNTSGNGAVIFSDDAENGDAKWIYSEPWERVGATRTFTQSYYLQWRNVSPTGGYDRSLAQSDWRYGPANPGLLVWYSNSLYSDNNITGALTDLPSFGPKGRMLVVDAHPEPYRWQDIVAAGFPNEAANLNSRGQMRDATFSLSDTPSFLYGDERTAFDGRPGVGLFSDAQGYYPGAEFVPRGPGYDAADVNAWITRQWDASAVIPARSAYGMNAVGYTAGSDLLYSCWTDTEQGAGLLNYETTAMSMDGGSGRPEDAFAGALQAYGWNVRILRQSDTSALLGIWNSAYTPKPVFLPVLRSLDDKTSFVDESVEVALRVLTPSEGAVEITANGLPEGVTLRPAEMKLAGTIAAGSQGLYDVTITASAGGLSDTKSFVWLVPNRAPLEPQLSGETALLKGEPVAVTVTATDPDHDLVLYSATGLPPGLTIDESGALQGVVDYAATEKEYKASIVVGDGELETAREVTFTIGNRAPELSSPGAQTSVRGEKVWLFLSGSDADHDTLTFSATGLPKGLTIEAESGRISGEIDPAADADNSVVVTVSDGTATKDAAFSWSVTDASAQLARVTDEPAGANCPAGGKRIDLGTDRNGDQTLQDAEIESTSYACTGVGILSDISDEAAGANCANGGKKVQFGLDTNGNETLDPGEVTSTRYVCAGLAKDTSSSGCQSAPLGGSGALSLVLLCLALLRRRRGLAGE